MKPKVALLQDFFEYEIIGGAEKNDSVLLNYLLGKKRIVDCIHTYKVKEVIDKYDFFIVSNFVRLPEDVMKILIQKGNYLIYEHDHKYVSNRNPGAFKNFIAPQNRIINREFYNSAKKVFVLSKICKEVIENNLQINNVHNISCSLWSKEDLDIIKQTNQTTGKSNEYGVMQSGNRIKGTAEALEYCGTNDIIPNMIQSADYIEFITKLSLCEKFIFFPQVLETFSRVCAEAKMLNCKVITTPKLVGFFSEDFSSLSGDELTDRISSNVQLALQKFEEVVFG
tara:strand:- start:2322 stop:3167 length:846 start_codon:yes stop_codon:yes gene_type:complete